MKKFSLLFAIIFILSLVVAVSVSAGSIDEELKLDIINRFNVLVAKDGEDWCLWRDGVKKEFNFDLIELSYTNLEFLEQEENEKHIGVLFTISIVGFVNNEEKIKKMVISIRTVVALYHKSKEFIRFEIVKAIPNIVLDGWDSKDT